MGAGSLPAGAARYSRRRADRTGLRGRRHPAQSRGNVVVEALEEAADDVLELAHALGAEEDRLVLGDVVLLGRHREDVERAQVGAAEFLDLAVRGEDPGAVGAHL